MNARQKEFIHRLAEYLVKDQEEKIIEVELGNPDVDEWFALRAASPVHGYLTVDEAEIELTRFLSEEKEAAS